MEDFTKLYDAATNAAANSYSPYSHFKVGAAILLDDGTIISGTNIENASYGLANCAERTTLFTAYTKGYRKGNILKMLIVGDSSRPISPCGACRQVMSELLELDCPVILTNFKKEVKETTVKELLPYSFSEGDLDV